MAADRPSGRGSSSSSATSAAIARGVSLFALAHGLRQAAAFGSLVVLAALLPPEAFGTVAASLVIIGVPSLLLGAGTRGAVITSGDLSLQQVVSMLLLNVGAGLGLAAVIALGASPLLELFAKGGDVDALRVMALTLPLQGLTIVPLALLQKRLQFKLHAGITTGSTVVAAVVAIVAAFFGAGIWALVLRHVLLHALNAVASWARALALLPPWTGRPRLRAAFQVRVQSGRGFFVLAAADFVAFNADYLIVGKFTDAERLGLYSLAFTLAFAPLTQLSWQVGGVLFPATAATVDPDAIRRRTVKGVRLLALALFPFVPAAITVAPPLLPRALGNEWTPTVLPFQILVVVGSAYAVINVIGESLSGTGNIGFRARVHTAAALGTMAALLVLVPAAGIDGAAVAHLLVFLPLGAAYIFTGTRLIGLDARDLGLALRGILVPVFGQSVVTAAGYFVLLEAGTGRTMAAIAAVGVGVVALIALLHRDESKPLREGGAVVRAVLGRA